MSQELRDCRFRCTVLTDAVLDSLAHGRGIERSEIIRAVMHRWALEQAKSIPETAKLLASRLKAEGLTGEGAGNGEGAAAQQNPDLEVTGVYKTLK